jgi:signal transduction histidine kinase
VAERLSRELQIFQRLARVVAGEPYDVNHILERIAAEFREAFEFERALLVRYRPEERTVHAVVQQGVDWPGDEWLLLEKFPFLEQALTTGEAVLVRDARAEAAMPSTIIERFGVRSIVAVPLLIEGRCLGFLVGDRHGGALGLSADDLALLTALGMVTAVFIDKADQYAELQEALEEVRGLEQAKSDFVSVASHELRTPIAVVHGIAVTLHVRGDDLRVDQLRDLRAALVEQTVRLRTLAEQLLDLSRVDSGILGVRHERFRPWERLDTLLARLAPYRRGEVTVDIDPELELESDPLAFERVVSNLLDNALRYGRPPIQVRTEDGHGFRLVVEDCGEGVSPDFVPQLFERFTRSDESRSRRSEGAGLGLAIAASFASAIGGTLSYEPADPSGARFRFVLPSSAAATNGTATTARV